VIALIVEFEMIDGCAAKFDVLIARTIDQISDAEPGTVIYICHQVTDDPTKRVLYELYRDRDAFAYHEAQAHTRRFIAEREQFLSKAPSVRFVTPMFGIPSDIVTEKLVAAVTG
jgi:quinol monooxygenase YgiN